MIPKIIWQTHEKQYNDLLPFQKNIINTWKNLNPGWKHIYVGAEERKEYIKEYDNFLYECYLASNGINQADIWRLVTLYQNGGVYADMDSVCTQPIDDILKSGYDGQDMVSGIKEERLSYANNSNFGSIKNSTIIKEMLNSIILEYRGMLDNRRFSIKKLPPGTPCLTIFSNTVIKNQDRIFFNTKYFSHSEDYKVYFNPQYHILYNNKKTDYLSLCILNNWQI